MPRAKTIQSPDHRREPLTHERLLAGALEVADAGGAGTLTIRSLAQHLGVKPMAIYHHVANKSEILDGILDLVFGEIELPSSTAPGERSWSDRRAPPVRYFAGTRGRFPCSSREPRRGRPPCATTTPSSACSAKPASPCR